MTRTVDLVVVGTSPAAVATATAAARRGQKVLIVTRARHTKVRQDLKRRLPTTVRGGQQLITVLAGAEVACVDGIKGIEAVVVRRMATGRLIAFNASAILFEDSLTSAALRMGEKGTT